MKQPPIKEQKEYWRFQEEIIFINIDAVTSSKVLVLPARKAHW